MSESTANGAKPLPHIPGGPPTRGNSEWIRRLARVESRNVTYTDDAFPVFWRRASGAMVEDTEGNHYLDFTSAFGVALAGHGHPRVIEALHHQADQLIHGMGDVHPPAVKVELLEKLTALSPWSDAKGILANTGSEAVEAALKTAQKVTGRAGVIAFEGAYHGLTLGALAVTDRDHFRRPFVDRLADHVRFVPFPRPSHTVDPHAPHPLELVRHSLESSATPIGAIIVEPIQGRAGVRLPLPGFLEALADLARESGALLIFDEIFTGMGRTGRLLAGEWEGVIPDLVCVGKALGGGMPISACLGPSHIMDAWPPSEGEAIHTSTFLGHPLSCAGALGFLRVLEEADLVGLAARSGEKLMNLLKQQVAPLEHIVSIRGRGLMIGIEFEGTDENEVPRGVAVASRALELGLLLLPAGRDGQVVELTPPAIVSDEQLEWGVDRLVDAIRATASHGGDLV